jgi:molybdenum ABC transporter molybdate-binding protein
MNGAWYAFLGSLALLAVLLGLLFVDPSRWFGSAREPLLVFCAAGIKQPVEAVALDYEREYGVEVQLQYGGSQTLLAQLEVSGRGDLYLPGDDSYLDTAREKGLVAEALPLARMMPVLAVPRGNPKGINTLDDLLRPGMRLAQANPEAAAVGKLTRAALESSGHWEALARRTVVYKPTVNDVANDVSVGTVDAGIVWDATVRQYPGLERVDLPALRTVSARVSVGVLSSTARPVAALHFARYLAACDRGSPIFAEQGYVAEEGDPWAEVPELLLLAGAMLRPAIEETVTAFEEREGVRVKRVYNGCGILVAQMKAAEHAPDLYFACDQSFMSQVHDLFPQPVEVSRNQLVILVRKGNPHGVRALDDLGKPGLRVGVGHEKQCALGVLTQETLVQNRSRERVMHNVKVQSPTGDMLVNQLRTGSLDAVVAYLSNAAEAADELEAIRIDVPCAVAVQPLAVGKDCRYLQLTRRLSEALRSEASRQRFEALGFRWQAGAG